MPNYPDFARYAQVAPVAGPVDFGASFRALAEQQLNQSKLREQMRQFNTESEMRQKEHQDLIQHQNNVEHDINARFASEQGIGIQEKRHAEEMAKQAEHEKAVQQARDLVVSGRWNEAMSLVGKLKDQGANVSVDTGPDGKPIFNLQARPDTTQPLQGDFSSIYSQISGQGQPQPGQSAQPSQPATRNPYETGIGSVKPMLDTNNPYQETAPNKPVFKSDDDTIGEIQDLKIGGVSADTQKQYGYSNDTVNDINKLDAAVNGTSKSPVSNATLQSTGGANTDAHAQPSAPTNNAPNPFALNTSQLQQWTNMGTNQNSADVSNQNLTRNPYALDTGRLQQWTNMRLDPTLKGIEEGIPARFRDEGHAYLQGLKSLGQTPETTLNTMQKPFDTLAGLWKGEMAADAASARLAMTQGGQESNRDLRVKGMGWQQMNQVANQLKLGEHAQKFNEIDQVDRMLGENNRMADSQILHSIRNMFQTGVATQKDIDAVQYGMKPLLQRIVDTADEQIMGTGLNPDSRAGLRRFLQSLKASHSAQLQEGAGQMESLLDTADSAEEAKSNLRYMNSIIPKPLWSDKQRKYNEMFSGAIEQKPPINHPTVKGKNSVSVSVKGKAAGPEPDPNDEAEQLLREINGTN